MKFTVLWFICLWSAHAASSHMPGAIDMRFELTQLCKHATQPATLTTLVITEFGAPEVHEKVALASGQRALLIVTPHGHPAFAELLIPNCDTFWQ